MSSLAFPLCSRPKSSQALKTCSDSHKYKVDMKFTIKPERVGRLIKRTMGNSGLLLIHFCCTVNFLDQFQSQFLSNISCAFKIISWKVGILGNFEYWKHYSAISKSIIMALGHNNLSMQTVIFTTIQTFYCLNPRKHAIADFFAVILNQVSCSDHDLQRFLQ